MICLRLRIQLVFVCVCIWGRVEGHKGTILMKKNNFLKNTGRPEFEFQMRLPADVCGVREASRWLARINRRRRPTNLHLHFNNNMVTKQCRQARPGQAKFRLSGMSAKERRAHVVILDTIRPPQASAGRPNASGQAQTGHRLASQLNIIALQHCGRHVCSIAATRAPPLAPPLQPPSAH